MESMTGYSSKALEGDKFSLYINAKSLNSRHLDVKFNASNQILTLEKKIRTLIKKNITRGFVDFNVSYIAFDINSDTEILKKWVKAYKKTSIELGVEDHLDLEKVLVKSAQHGLSSFNKADEKKILDCVSASLKALKAERLKEGEELKKVLLKNVEGAQTIFKKIEKKVILSKKKLKLKWDEKIKLISSEVSEDRVAFEVALFLEKADISEEIDRLKIHLVEFVKIINSKSTLKGKSLDFYCQEFNRETNTMASKIKDSSVTRLLVDLKSIFEVVREQVQNLQ